MALSGKFLADFSSFYDAVQKAEVSLRSFETGAGKVEGSLNRMVDNFSGRKVITDAGLMTEAVTRVGGASALTATEMATVNARVGEAIAKFTALGQAAPPAMLRLHAETAKLPPTLGGMMSSLAPLAGAFGVAFSAGAVVNFGRAILNDADALVKLSDKTGIAIGPLQGLKYAAEQSGNTFEQITGAISMMQKRIGDGDESAVGALRKLGLSMEQFKALSPDQQFTAIAREVATIEDPMERVRVATAIFGRSGAEILATLISKIDELTSKAPKMKDEAARAFDDIGDAIDRMSAMGKTGIGNFAADAIDGFARIAQAAGDLLNGDFGRIPASLIGFQEGLPSLPPALDGLKRSTDGVTLSMGAMDRISRELTKTTQEGIAKQEAFKRGQDALFGRDVIERALDYAARLGNVSNLTLLVADKKKELTTAVEKAMAVYEALGEKAPAALLKIVAATRPAAQTMAELDAEITKLHAKSLPPFSGLLQNVDRTLDALPPHVAAFRSELVFTAEVIETQITPALEEMTAKANAAVMAMGAASRPMGDLSVGVGAVNPATGAGKTGTDPRVWAYLEQGYTLGEAVALASGAPTNIGAAHGYWDKTGWHSGTRGGTAGMRGLAGGGAMQAGETAWVGERGPELFRPHSAGMISPHGAGSTVNNITVNVATGDGQAIARVVQQAMVDLARAQGKRL